MSHQDQLFMTTVLAGEHLVLEIKRCVGWLN